MKEKILNIFWSVSLMLTGLCSLITSVSNLAGIALPNLAVRLIGLVQLLSLGILVYSTVKKLALQRGNKHET